MAVKKKPTVRGVPKKKTSVAHVARKAKPKVVQKKAAKKKSAKKLSKIVARKPALRDATAVLTTSPAPGKPGTTKPPKR